MHNFSNYDSGSKPVVVYIITKLELGGAQKVCLELFNHFFPNSYLISSSDGTLLDTVKGNPHFFAVPTLKREASFFSVFSEFYALLQIFFILRKLRKQHPNLVVHTHSSKAGILGRIAAYFAGIKKIIHTVHGFGMTSDQGWITTFIFRGLEQIGTLLTTSIICVSKRDLQLGSSLFWGFKKKACIIRAAIDQKPFLQQQDMAKMAKVKNNFEGKIIIGSVSCFKPQKNLLDLIKAFYLAVKLSEPQGKLFELQIIGDGDMRSSIENRITKYKLQRQIKLLGWQRNVAPLMANWDTFTLSSLWEGPPCSLVQAQILKQFSICYDTGGIYELIIESENGFLVPQKNIFSFSIALLRAGRRDLQKLHFEKLDYFFIETMLEQHAKLYL